MKSTKLSRRARSTETFGFQPLEARQLLSAVVTLTVGTQTLNTATPIALTLANHFADNAVAAGDTVVDLNTSSGSIPVELTNSATPATVANFLKYVANGYANTIIHRDVPKFVMQAGGYTTDGKHITTTGNVVGESATATLKNTTGTLAMALSTGPDSGTSEWFVNLNNNPFLDDTSDGGPFTAFGKVIYNGMSVVNSISAVGQVNASAQNRAWDTLPVNGTYTGQTADSSVSVLPVASANPIPAADLITINPRVLPNSGLKYSVMSSNPALVTASLVNGVLTMTPTAGAATGNATVTVTATDLGGGTAKLVIPVVYTAVVTGSLYAPAGVTLHLVAGQTFSGNVGGFDYAGTLDNGHQFSASIDFGDTGGASGNVVYLNGTSYETIGGHGYTAPGTYPITLTLRGQNDPGVVIHSVAIVTAPQTSGSTFTPTPITFNPVVNQAYAATVGGFSFSNPSAKASDFTAIIDYGDTGGAAGTVVSTAPGMFSVIGGHGYSAAKSFAVNVTVTGPNGLTTIIHSTAQVQAGTGGTTLTLTPTGLTFHPQPGKPYAATVGSFASSDLTLKATDFSAYIDYGDTGAYAGNIFQTSPGVFNVVGGHGYAAGNFQVKVIITGPGGTKTTINSVAAVA